MLESSTLLDLETQAYTSGLSTEFSTMIHALYPAMLPSNTGKIGIPEISETQPTTATTSMQTSPRNSPQTEEIPILEAQLVNESQMFDSTTIPCTLNNEQIQLRFNNSGQNDLSDLQTYLQEKLDVLEFIQQDHTRKPASRPPQASGSSRIYIPSNLRPQSSNNDPSMSVGDWLKESEAPSFISNTSVSTAGFFIGTPVPSVCGSDDAPIIEAALLNDSEIRWETDSMMSSPSSSHRRGSSRSRVRSTSSNASSRNGFFGNHASRNRASRLASSYAADEASFIDSTLGTSVLGKSYDRNSPDMGFNFASRWF